jgi:hypothetical protein
MAQLGDGGSHHPWHDALTNEAQRSNVGCEHDGGDEEGGGIICNTWKKTDYEWFADAKE